jgi:hypothetical protein
MFNSGLSPRNKQKVHEMYERNMEPVTIARYIGTDLSRVNMEISNYERELESKSYIDRMAAHIEAMIW